MIKPIAVEILLDKPRTLIFGWRARLLLEREINRFRGTPAKEWIAWPNLLRNFTFDVMQGVIWSALLHEDPGLTFEQAGALLENVDLSYIEEKIGEIFEKQNPKNAANGEDHSSRPLAHFPGSSSGPFPESS